jgi:hypothetical protein
MDWLEIDTGYFGAFAKAPYRRRPNLGVAGLLAQLYTLVPPAVKSFIRQRINLKPGDNNGNDIGFLDRGDGEEADWANLLGGLEGPDRPLLVRADRPD